MSSLLSPMWFCSAFFSMLLCTLKTKCALLCFIKSISHLHLLQHYRTHSLHPSCHTFWECQRVNISVYLHNSCFGKVAGLTCCQFDNLRERHLRLLSHRHDPLFRGQWVGRSGFGDTLVTGINEGGNRLISFMKEMRPGDNSVACGKEEESPRGDHKWDCKGWQPVLNSLVC